MKRHYPLRHSLIAFTLGTAIGSAIGTFPSIALAANAAAETKVVQVAKVEEIGGSSAKKITLIQSASDRLDIKIGKIQANAAGRLTTPYSTLLYDIGGKTWVYTNPEPLVFVRERVQVESIQDKVALLKGGPAAGTRVVVLGVAELHGIESGVGH